MRPIAGWIVVTDREGNRLLQMPGPRQLRESLLLNSVAFLSLAHRSSFC